MIYMFCVFYRSGFALILFLSVIKMTTSQAAVEKITLPPCPINTKQVFYPNEFSPRWEACQDSQGLLQGFLAQYTLQQEIIRLAYLKNSKRHGMEIRAGRPGTLEERRYLNGHLDGYSFIFKTDTLLARVLPKPMSQEHWLRFSNPTSDAFKDSSFLQTLIKTVPISKNYYTQGRITQVQYEKLNYQFTISPDERIYATNHPEMKKLFFTDPEPLWSLDADDLKAALLQGFGSCKKYSAPISRYTRYYDSLLYRRESSEKKYLTKLQEMRDRFLNYCIPKDLTQALGVLECPPQLPSPRPEHLCATALSDQLRIPYQPKYFKFKLTEGYSPEALTQLLESKGLYRFLSNYDQDLWDIQLNAKLSAQVKKTYRGLLFKTIKTKDAPKTGFTQDWWTWQPIPGF